MPAKRARPAISVALATYNGERFIGEQLASIKNQTLLPTEIVISDDNSKDRTLEVVAEVLDAKWRSTNNVKVKVLTNTKALGPGPNFEQALKACTGDYIVLCDQDDLWHPDKVQTLCSVLASDDLALLVHSDARLVNAEGQPLGMKLSEGIAISQEERELLASGKSLPAFAKRNLATGATMMVKRELVSMAFPLPPRELHDGWLALTAALVDGVRFLPRELTDYRQHGGNQIGGKPLSATDSLVAILKSWGDMTEGLKERNRDVTTLMVRLGSRVSPINQAIVRNRIAHNQWRISLPSSRILRVWPVLWGVVRGRYRRYGRQPHDVLRDLFMPPREIFLGLLRFFRPKT